MASSHLYPSLSASAPPLEYNAISMFPRPRSIVEEKQSEAETKRINDVRKLVLDRIYTLINKKEKLENVSAIFAEFKVTDKFEKSRILLVAGKGVALKSLKQSGYRIMDVVRAFDLSWQLLLYLGLNRELLFFCDPEEVSWMCITTLTLKLGVTLRTLIVDMKMTIADVIGLKYNSNDLSRLLAGDDFNLLYEMGLTRDIFFNTLPYCGLEWHTIGLTPAEIRNPHTLNVNNPIAHERLTRRKISPWTVDELKMLYGYEFIER